jgi:hypothetical protein
MKDSYIYRVHQSTMAAVVLGDGILDASAEDAGAPRVQQSCAGAVPYPVEDPEAATRAAIAKVPAIARERLLALAKTHSPPPSWYEEEDDLF